MAKVFMEFQKDHLKVISPLPNGKSFMDENIIDVFNIMVEPPIVDHLSNSAYVLEQ